MIQLQYIVVVDTTEDHHGGIYSVTCVKTLGCDAMRLLERLHLCITLSMMEVAYVVLSLVRARYVAVCEGAMMMLIVKLLRCLWELSLEAKRCMIIFVSPDATPCATRLV